MDSIKKIIQPKNIFQRLSFPLFAEIKKYENTSKPRVIQLINQIERDNLIRNPIIWDREKNLLIDGHHRIEALSLLGFKRIPAYHTDYLGKDVQIFPWYRIVYQVSVERILEMFNFLKAPEYVSHKGDQEWKISIKLIGGKIIATKSFETSFEATNFLDWFYLLCKNDGFGTELSAQLPTKKWKNSNSIFLFISPIVDKDEVLKAASNSLLFPSQVNRHVVENRLINVSYPLNQIINIKEESDLSYFKNKLKCGINNRGTWFDGRFYQETTIQLLNK